MAAASKLMKQGKIVQTAPRGLDQPSTPPDSPTAQLSDPLEFARQVIHTVKLIQTSEPKEASPSAAIQANSIVKQPEPIIQASKLEVKEVQEM